MNIYEDHYQWIADLGPNVSLRRAAAEIGVTPGGLSKALQRNDNKLNADYVLKLARAFNKPPVEALVETGLIPPESLNQRPPTDEERRELLREIMKQVADKI